MRSTSRWSRAAKGRRALMAGAMVPLARELRRTRSMNESARREPAVRKSYTQLILPVAAARAAGLRYVANAGPGIRRQRAGKTFRYLAPAGKALRDAETLSRIRALAIPPAWRDVWICPLEDGHLQAI